MRNIKIWTCVVLIVLLASSVIGYCFAITSDAYRTLDSSIKSSPYIKNRFGENLTMSLDYFGYSIRFSGSSGHAEFNASIKGTRDAANLSAILEKNDVWQISSMRINGKQISLNR
ncbi:hypothetical protein [Variovorax sp. SRS16]|uniref:hypothetical protein n=1 Tax=Variovorax sp. SRS16 TaxID=282217 RepID=UPI0013A5A43E|nr:hypothetical protein [Variovorax sp. SRS16]